MTIRAAVLTGGVALAVLATATPAQAQTRSFNVSEQPAVSGIPEFARQAQIQIIAPAGDLQGVRTKAVIGSLDIRVALRRLLEGTPLRIVSDNGKLIMLQSTVRAVREKGSVTGQVLNPVTGNYMRDAIIRLTTAEGDRHVTTVDNEGAYRIADLPAGTAQITVSYTGYEEISQTVEITAGGTTTLNFDLQQTGVTQASSGNDIVVTGTVREGDARAIMSQRKSMNITNSLSSESFGDIAEGNVGEFIKFMPGVDTAGEGDDTVRYVRLRGLPSEYTAITVNGVRMAAADANDGSTTSRSFSFEQVSLSSVDSIEISKTISADVDANAPAGTINLRTKRAFDRKGRRINVQLSGYTHDDMWRDRVTGPGEGKHEGRFRPNGQLEYSDVFFGNRLGVVASISQSKTYTEMEQVYYPRSYVPTAASPEPLALTSIYAHMRAQEVSRFASSLTLDFRATDALTLSMAGIYNRSHLWSGQRAYSFITGARAAGVIGDPAVDFTTKSSTASVEAVSNAISKRGKGLTLLPSFEYKHERFTLDGNFSYSNSTSNYDPLGNEGAIFSLATAPNARGSFSVHRSGLDTQDWAITQLTGADWSDAASYTSPTSIVLNTQDGRWARTELWGGGLNLSFHSPFEALPILFKTGVKFQRAVYDFANERAASQYRYTGPLSPAAFLALNQSANELSFDQLDIDITSLSGSSRLYMPSNQKIGQMFLSNPDLFEHTLTAANYYTAYIANRRHFEEDTNAAYFMGTADITARLKFRAGLRWEQTRTRAREFDALSADAVRAAGYAVTASTGRASTLEGIKYQYESNPLIDRKGSYDYFFPSASLKFSPTDSLDIQLGYSRTIRRPEVNILAGVWSVNDATLTVTAPNPGLKPEVSDNFSARIVKYFEPVGLVAINYFQNRVKGQFQTEEMTAEEFGYTGTDYAGYIFRTTRTVSGDAINIRGLELELNHSLDYLPGLLSGLTVRGSYTYTAPEVPIALSARHLISASLAYKKGPIAFNLNSLWTGRKLNSAATGSYIRPRTDMNFSGSYSLSPRVRLFMSMRNLLNEKTLIMLPGVDTPGGPVGDHAGDYRAYGRSATFGIRATF
ncbi:TonB-dependent receptor [Sphingobium lignivorans]|uniref:TonB-dependent receptor n=1 Tax=Sphingobium lignivorans TaxID=2735886 RepID=A0ABR6NKL3_9SPHN|nr:TonB-dependent receptor [Sphingobium lignivorans]MBB5987038.1 TonB-dependent receptor [Sphingobium lignivorans]